MKMIKFLPKHERLIKRHIKRMCVILTEHANNQMSIKTFVSRVSNLIGVDLREEYHDMIMNREYTTKTSGDIHIDKSIVDRRISNTIRQITRKVFFKEDNIG